MVLRRESAVKAEEAFYGVVGTAYVDGLIAEKKSTQSWSPTLKSGSWTSFQYIDFMGTLKVCAVFYSCMSGLESHVVQVARLCPLALLASYGTAKMPS